MKKFLIAMLVVSACIITCSNPANDEINTRRENLSYTLIVGKHINGEGENAGNMRVNGGEWFNGETKHYTDLGETVRVCAQQEDGFLFTHWTNAVGGNVISHTPCDTIKEMDGHKTYIANFSPARTLTIERKTSEGTVDGVFWVRYMDETNIIDTIPLDTLGYFVFNSEIEICEGTHNGQWFDNWTIIEEGEEEEETSEDDNDTDEDDDGDGTEKAANTDETAANNNCVRVKMDRDREIIAHFTPAYTLTINYTNTPSFDIGGVITVDTTNGVSDSLPSSSASRFVTTHLTGTNVRVCADSLAEGFRFDGWSGDVNSQELCIDVVMTRNMVLNTRIIRQHRLTLARTTNGVAGNTAGGSITVRLGDENGSLVSAGNFDYGTDLYVCANPAGGYRFDGWSGASTAEDNCTPIRMTEDRSLTASFWQPFLRITRTLQDGGWVEVYRHSNNAFLNSYGPQDNNPEESRHPLPAIRLDLCAEAEYGFEFIGWSGDVPAASRTDKCIEGLLMDINRDITAHFRIGFNTDEINYGTLTDYRDNQEYRTVSMSYEVGGVTRNITWMAENLNYNPGGTGSWCYANSEANCDIYGRLYNWNTAMDGGTSSSANPSGRRGICPSGWHLPSRAEWVALTNAFGANELKSFVGWDDWGNGSNGSGFTAIPGGFRFPDGTFSAIGVNGQWWTATEYNTNNAWYYTMSSDNYDVESDDAAKTYGLSVRCVRD